MYILQNETELCKAFKEVVLHLSSMIYNFTSKAPPTRKATFSTFSTYKSLVILLEFFCREDFPKVKGEEARKLVSRNAHSLVDGNRSRVAWVPVWYTYARLLTRSSRCIENDAMPLQMLFYTWIPPWLWAIDRSIRIWNTVLSAQACRDREHLQCSLAKVRANHFHRTNCHGLKRNKQKLRMFDRNGAYLFLFAKRASGNLVLMCNGIDTSPSSILLFNFFFSWILSFSFLWSFTAKRQEICQIYKNERKKYLFEVKDIFLASTSLPLNKRRNIQDQFLHAKIQNTLVVMFFVSTLRLLKFYFLSEYRASQSYNIRRKALARQKLSFVPQGEWTKWPRKSQSWKSTKGSNVDHQLNKSIAQAKNFSL